MENINNLLVSVEDYIETQKELIRLQVIDKTSTVTSTIASTLIIVLLFMLMFLFFSLAAAWFLSEYFGKTSIGFSLVGLFYLLIGIILVINKDKWLNTPMMNSMIKKMSDHE
jgi:hypothetical protein